jgi:hypothetical protein
VHLNGLRQAQVAGICEHSTEPLYCHFDRLMDLWNVCMYSTKDAHLLVTRVPVNCLTAILRHVGRVLRTASTTSTTDITFVNPVLTQVCKVLSSHLFLAYSSTFFAHQIFDCFVVMYRLYTWCCSH